MSYYGTPLRSKSEFECSECGCYRNDSYCWNCDEIELKRLAKEEEEREEELDPMRGVEFTFADNH